MSNGLTRRQFLQAGAMAAAATVISGCTVNLQRTETLESYVKPPEEGLPGENLWFASTCRQCPAGCGIVVRVSNGRARKIEGNPAHPVNQGKLCARGQAILQEMYDPDRLRNAVRQSMRSMQEFGPIYWDDALRLLSEQLHGVDPARVAFLGSNLSTHLWHVANRFMQGLGAREPVIYSLGDALSGQQALASASNQLFGTPSLPLFDIGAADAVFSFGASFLETWISPVLYSQAYSQMRRGSLGKRGYLVQFEPRLSSTAGVADQWVPVQPGSEGLVALALGKLLVEQENLGGPQHAALYQAVDVGAVAEVSGVQAEELGRLARIFAGVERAVAIPGGAAVAHPDSGTALVAIHALNDLVGGWGRPGGVYFSAASAGDAFEPAPASSFADVQSLIDDMDSGRVQFLFVHGANPAFELPKASGFREAMLQVSYTVSFSPTVDDTAVHADLILPDHTNLEGWGYHVPLIADRTVVSSQQPVMRPLYDTRATVDVLLALARQLGGDVARALPWPNEVTFLREATGAFRSQAVDAEAYWAGWRRQGGHWDTKASAASPPAAAELVLASVPASPVSAGVSDAYPYQLHLYPSIALFDGRGANKSWLQETPDPMTTVAWQTWIEIDPTTAQALGVGDDDIVRVISEAGEVEAIVYVYRGLAAGVVAMPLGRGQEQSGRYASGQGSNPMRLVASTADDGTGVLTWGATAVRIEPTGRKKALARLESAEGVEYLRQLES
jgi:anaerobic selenocysteine-containing dehydrogenase